MKNPYEILGIASSSSDETIKKAYRELALKHHPDKAGDSPESKRQMQAINDAYASLRDPVKKRKIDQAIRFEEIKHSTQHDPAAGFGDWLNNLRNQKEAERRREQFHTAQKWDDFVDEVTNGRSEFNDTFGVHKPDLNVYDSIWVSQRILTTGGRVNHETSTLTDCPNGCAPFNGINYYDSCEFCSGEGKYWFVQTIQVHIPAGTKPHELIRLKGKGLVGLDGNPGDLILQVRVSNQSASGKTSMKPLDVYANKQISLHDAFSGGEFVVHNGQQEYVIEVGPLIYPGKVVKSTGRGKRNKQGQQGDLYVQFTVVYPDYPTDSEWLIIEKLNSVKLAK